MNLFRRLWLKFKHGKVLGEFHEDATKAFGYAGAIASSSLATEVAPIHLFYGVLRLRARDPGNTKHAAALSAIEEILGRTDEHPTQRLPSSESLREIAQTLVGDMQKSQRFQISLGDVEQLLLQSDDETIVELVNRFSLRV